MASAYGRGVSIRWVSASLDVPGDRFEADCRFWAAVTATRVSREPEGERVTLSPAVGDAYLRIRRVGGGLGGCQLDLHTDRPAGLVAAAVAGGARAERRTPALSTLRSPAGLPFRVAAWRGEQRRPPPQAWPDGQRSLVDQVCIDIPPGAYAEECEFWATLTGWGHRAGSRPEFRYLPRPAGMPLRLLLQRLDDPAAGAARAHLDLACSDVAAERRRHEALGAVAAYDGQVWSTLRDPAGLAYCVTRRDPDTGTL